MRSLAANLNQELQSLRRAYDQAHHSATNPNSQTLIRCTYERLHRLAKILWQQHQEPARLGWAVFWGVFIGTQPLYGIHLPLSVLAGFLFRLNKLVVYAAAHISLPIFIPFLLFFSLQLGSLIFTGQFLKLTLNDAELLHWNYVQYLFTGSLALGLGLGVIAGGLVYVVASFFGSPTWRMFKILRHSDPFLAGYIVGKNIFDPLFRQVLPLISSDARILDLGGGIGLAPLLSKSNASHVVHDWDDRRLKAGSTIARILRKKTTYCKTDIFSTSFDASVFDVILLLDVLHYQPAQIQSTLIENIVATSPKICTIIVRDIDSSSHFSSVTITQFLEHIAIRIGFTKANVVHKTNWPGIERVFKQEKFQITSKKSSYLPIFKNRILIASRT